ncbi:hypothetical protein [Kaistella jeonii]|uniref:Uncharacterized protein n=1 Tax=Kaistella jeonii TaxID=266749 RepID=A0A0C1D314_9FLAO|nr:hypothetical protein [Kaistella jeonii]KIA88170.1 hypothetical protein OA86_12175 [Kaistella jeonii]SFC28308.1 hypothetical protein SAMN05421876_1122 [Kaistella jeonii]VEI96931.1 Uncharacterised protein [Kaistella jeonii]
MKKLISAILLTGFTLGNAQVIIGDAIGTASVKTSVLLEFALGNKGLILPYVRTLPAPAPITQGTILLDASTATAARVKFSNGTSWVDLSGQDANVTAALTIQPTSVVETTSKSIIGARSSSADGVLVLESSTKAMVLPQVNKVSDIPSPSPGMMVYVNKTGAKRLAVYNGSKWSYWKP